MKKLLLCLVLMLSLASVSIAGTITDTGVNQGDLVKLLDNMHLNALYHSNGLAGMAMVSSPNSENVLTTTTINYVTNGVMFTLIPSTNIDISGFSSYGAQTYATYPIRHYLFSVDDSGDYGLTRSSGDWLPNMKSGYTPIADLKIELDANGTFTLGTTALDATSVNATYTEYGTLNSGGNKVKLTDL